MLSSLLLIPMNKIDLHEAHEVARLQYVHDSIVRQGYLRNPLLAIEMNNGRYLLIDGAHRFQALQKAGCIQVPVQILRQTNIKLSTWLHQVRVGTWLDDIYDNPAFELCSSYKRGWIASIVDDNGVRKYLLSKKK